MVPRVSCVWVLGAAVVVGGCSHTPTAPTPLAQIVALPAADAIREVLVVGDQWIWTTSSPVQMTARLITRSQPQDYFPMTTGMRWSVDPAGVVTIDQRGIATVVSVGAATITARLGDKAGTLAIRVLPNFAGTWRGMYRNVSCSGLTPDVRTCFNNTFAPLRMSLSLTQDRDQVSGTLKDLNESRGIPLTGSISVSGLLSLAGGIKQSPLVQPLRVENWSSRLMPDGTQAGSFVSHGYLVDILGNTNSFDGRPYEIILQSQFDGLVRSE